MQCTTIRPMGVLIPAALLLSACSSANEAKEDITTTAEAAPSTEVAASSDPTLDTINEGEPFTITCDGDRTCDIDVTISNVALHDQCPRVASYVDAPPRSRPISPLTRRSPSMSTPGRITSPSPPATRKCSRRTDIRSRWASHSIANLCPPQGIASPAWVKTAHAERLRGTCERGKAHHLTPRGATKAWVLDLPGAPAPAQGDDNTSELPAQPAQLVDDATAPPAPPVQDTGQTTSHCLTDHTLYQRGTTVFTDGTTGWTKQCAAEFDAAL